MTQHCCGCAWRPPTVLSVLCKMGFFPHPILSTSSSSFFVIAIRYSVQIPEIWLVLTKRQLIIHLRGWPSNLLSDSHLISREVKSLNCTILTDWAWESPDKPAISVSGICPVRYHVSQMYATYICRLHTWKDTQACSPSCCGSLVFVTVTHVFLGGKTRVVSGYKPTSATFDTHLSLFLSLPTPLSLSPSLSHSHTHAHVLSINPSKWGNKRSVAI